MDIMEQLEAAGAVLLDHHFVYKSGKHGTGYINMDPLFTKPNPMNAIGVRLAAPFINEDIDTFVGPATGGILLAYVAALGYAAHMRSMPAVAWADKVEPDDDGNDFAFERAGFVDQLNGRRVVIAEDLLTTGGSVAKVAQRVEQAGGNIVGVSVICNRGGVTSEAIGGYPLYQLADVDFVAWDAADCPLCRNGVPIVNDIGHGDAYQKDHPGYPGTYISLLG